LSRILALDIGTKRIGIAISDPLGMFSRGLPTITRKPEDKSIGQINSACAEYKVLKIIVGLPVNMNGTSGKQVDDVKEYVSKFTELIEAEIIYQDERLTSELAKEYLIEQNISPARNKELVDQKAAEIILQEYLDSNSR